MRYCRGSEQELLAALGVIDVCQDSKKILMRKFPLSKIYTLLNLISVMVMRTSMISNSKAFPHIPSMFFSFSRGKGFVCFVNVVPRAIATGDFIDNIEL